MTEHSDDSALIEVLRALAATYRPVDPDPDFAAGLRARLALDLIHPRGDIMVTLTDDTPAPQAEPVGAAVPYLAVSDGRRALDWYSEVLDARLSGEPIVMPDGRIGHAELEVGAGLIYLAEEFPEIGVVAPEPGRVSVSLSLPVADLAATLARATGAGARLTGPPYEDYGQLNATVVDPFGHRWLLHGPLPAPAAAREVSAGYRQGDVGYVSVLVPDPGAATAFYSAVLGWQFREGRVAGATPDTSIRSGQERPTLFCCYVVHDLPAAAERVRAAGGTAAEPVERPYGGLLDCVDDQGTAFALWRPSAEWAARPRPPANGFRAGDLSYLTLQVVDSARARAFYGAVLGWSFSPGRVEDGWGVGDTVPMIGLHGGHDRATAVPMWRVDDTAAAVARIRAAGGTAGEPAVQPYGVTAECADDQGTPFYVGS